MTATELERDSWNPPSLEGTAIRLRRHRPEDLPALIRWYRDPELAHLTRYSLRPMPIEEIERFFHSRLLSPESIAYGIHVIGDDRLIGLTTFSSLDPDNGSVLFHITIGERDAWDKGYGTEATTLMLRLAFERLALHRVGLSVFSFNPRAIRSYEKAGFRVEGRLREAIQRDGRFWDEVQMGVLADEWLAERSGLAGARSVGAGPERR